MTMVFVPSVTILLLIIRNLYDLPSISTDTVNVNFFDVLLHRHRVYSKKWSSPVLRIYTK